MKPTICHLGAWGKNWGDRAIQYALQNAVGRDEYEWWSNDIQGATWDLTGTPMVNHHAALLLVGGGGLLWDKPELNSPSGWQWQATPEVIEDLDVPIIVHAIGDTRFPYGNDPTGQKPEFKESLQILAEKALSFSVRNTYTQELLADIGVVSTLCPDPALFMGGPMTIPADPPILGVCLAWDKTGWRWPGKYGGRAALSDFMDALSESLEGFVRDGWKLRPFCHIPEDDPTVGFCEDVARTAGMEPNDVIRYADYERCHVPLLVEWYAECTAVVSMRKHGIYIPAGLGVPVVGLGDLGEVRATCEQLAVPKVDSLCATPELFTQVINEAMLYHGNRAPYADLQAAHDSHIDIIRRARE